MFGAGNRTRTGTLLPARDFKSLVSTIPPHRRILCLLYHVLWKVSSGGAVFAVPPRFSPASVPEGIRKLFLNLTIRNLSLVEIAGKCVIIII